MSIRSILALAAVLCAAPLTVSAAQQAPEAALVAAPAAPAQVSAPDTPLSGPRVAPQFQRAEPTLAPSNAADRSALKTFHKKDTIVLSTLALVLVVVIIVLLVAR